MTRLQHRSPSASTSSASCPCSMYRKFRRFRVTAMVYTCGSLCGILLLISFNEEVKKLLQPPTYNMGASHEHDHNQIHSNMIESAILSSRDILLNSDNGNGDNLYKGSFLDENSQQSKARQNLNLVLSGSLTQSTRQSIAKPWFMWRGSRFPTVETSTGSLWPEENPNSDRILEQLMYVTQDDINQLSREPLSLGSALYNSLRLESVFGRNSGSNDFNRKMSPYSSRATKDTTGDRKVNPSQAQNQTIPKLNKNDPSPAPKKSKLKTILLYYGLGMSWGSHIVSGRHVFLQQKCPVNACRLTGNRSQLSEADIVLFKDVFMNPKVKRPLNQLWVIYMLECPLNTQNFMDKNVFNLTATYRHDSDIVTPYEKWVYHDEKVRALPQGINYAAGKTKKIAWFVSNCVAKNNRLEYARELGKYIEVDIYGACGSHACSRANAKQCFDILSKTYKFYLAFENSNCRDYISEKFFVNGLGNNVLPIVMGAHPDDYKRQAPYKSYIHVDDFASPKELAKYLTYLDENDGAYNEYFEWKGTGEFVNTHFFCRLCAMAHYADRSSQEREESSEPFSRYYKDFNNWWRGPNICTRRSWRNHFDVFANNRSNPPDFDTVSTTSHLTSIVA